MLTRDQALHRLNVAPGVLEILVDDGIILELRDSGSELYPELQFSENGIDTKFASLLGLFRNLRITGDTIWKWLNSPLEELSQLTPLEYFAISDSSESIEELRFVAASIWSIEVLVDPALERTDWLQTAHSAEDQNGVGDYTPKRRGGQHAA